MDEINKSILRLLSQNGRMSFSEIGDKLGISRVAVKKRVKKLENEGVIRGYRAVIHRKGMAKMFMMLSTTEKEMEEVVYYLNRSGYVKEMYTMTGGNKIMAVAEAPELSELKYLVKMLNKTFSGKKTTGKGNVVLEVIRDDFGGVRYDEARYRGDAESHKRDESVS